MEPRFGHDFSQVRLHTDGRAAKSARAVDALAYTVGSNVVFGEGQHQPGTLAGQRLLAHELSHVVQQGRAASNANMGMRSTVSERTRIARQPSPPSGAMLQIEDSDSATEREADHISYRIAQGGMIQRGLSPQRHGLQRQAAPATQAPPAQQPQPAPQAPPISAIQNVRVGNVARFDAELDRRAVLDPSRRSANEPCRLTLTVKVRFNFRDSQTPSRWTPAEQTRWQNQFIRSVSDRWSFRFLLVPSQPCANEPCQLAAAILRIQPVTANPHNTMTVHYDKPSDARSSVGARTSTLYRPDVERPGSDLRTNQTTATHEAGHLLGLEHVHCDTNSDECYGINREESADVMGRGEIVTERDYAPFVTAMQQLTGCSWRVRDGQRGPLFGNASTVLGAGLGIAGGIVGAVLGAALGPLGAVLGGLAGAALGGLAGFALGSLFD
jgi:hypothetical protein